MDNSDRHGGKRTPPRGVRMALCLVVALSLSIAACATLSPSDPRDEAVRLYRYQGLRDELIVEPPRLSAVIARPGERITREITFTLLSPQREKKFVVAESVTLKGVSLAIELSKQESEKLQGSHLSTIQVTVPKDVPPGVYTIITKIATEEQQMTQKAHFQVHK
jgi:hypothetical protein